MLALLALGYLSVFSLEAKAKPAASRCVLDLLFTRRIMAETRDGKNYIHREYRKPIFDNELLDNYLGKRFSRFTDVLGNEVHMSTKGHAIVVSPYGEVYFWNAETDPAIFKDGFSHLNAEWKTMSLSDKINWILNAKNKNAFHAKTLVPKKLNSRQLDKIGATYTAKIPKISSEEAAAYLNTQALIEKVDSEGNQIFVSPRGKGIIITPSGRVFPLDLKFDYIYFQGKMADTNLGFGLKTMEYKTQKISESESKEIRFEYRSNVPIDVKDIRNALVLTEKIHPSLVPGAPVVRVTSDKGSSVYSDIDWKPFYGKTVNVLYHGGSPQEFAVPQRVLGQIELERLDPVTKGAISEIVNEGTGKSKNALFSPEVGIWVVRSQGHTLASASFSSGSFRSISGEAAFPSMIDTVRNLLRIEPGAEFRGLTLLHTHPISGAALSPADYKTLRQLAESFGLEEGDEAISVIAIPVPDRGKLGFEAKISAKDLEKSQ